MRWEKGNKLDDEEEASWTLYGTSPHLNYYLYGWVRPSASGNGYLCTGFHDSNTSIIYPTLEKAKEAAIALAVAERMNMEK
jgi:hypothetical protein